MNQAQTLDATVILTTYNRAEVLRQTLEDFTRLETSGIDWEFIVVDNRCTDHTREVIREFEGVLPLRYLFVPTPGTAAARNAAVRQARAELCVLTDDDVSPDPRWLAEMLAASRRYPEAAGFGGYCQEVYPVGCSTDLREAIRDVVRLEAYDWGPGDLPLPQGYTPIGGNMALRRMVFTEHGFAFDERLGPIGTRRVAGHEVDLFLRVRASGGELVYVGSARVRHRLAEGQLTPKALRRRAVSFGRGMARTNTFGSSPRLMNVPRFLLRLCAQSAARAMLAGLLRRRWQALRYNLLCAKSFGAIYESWRMGREKTRTTTA